MSAPRTTRHVEKATALGPTVYLYDGAKVVGARSASGVVVPRYAQGLDT